MKLKQKGTRGMEKKKKKEILYLDVKFVGRRTIY